MSNKAWYTLHTKSRKEAHVYNYLCATNIEVFYPTIKVKPVNPRASKIRAFFPRYLFARVDIDEVGLSALQWVPGMSSVVSFGGELAIVQDHYIDELRRCITEIDVISNGVQDNLASGDQIRIASGQFTGYEAIFDMQLNGAERVQVLLRWLGRQVKVVVNVDVIEKK